MENEDLNILRDSIRNDNLVGRLEKLTVFIETLSYNIVNQETPEEESELVLERVTVQKKVYEKAQRLYALMKEDEINKEEAEKSLEDLSRVFEEFRGLKDKN